MVSFKQQPETIVNSPIAKHIFEPEAFVAESNCNKQMIYGDERKEAYLKTPAFK